MTAQYISVPSFPSRPTVNLATLINSVAPFFHDGHRVPVHAPSVAQLDEQRGGADDREQSAGNTGGNKSEMNVHEIYSDLNDRSERQERGRVTFIGTRNQN